ncbi:MAG: universal stress protein [Chloroflexi bacterium]|nr:universal stress protein [Chloroflexota bacterium]MDA1228505.1 universal stress protein [Chloroflexota bacterium]
MFNKILVPLDGSEMTEGILPFVSHLAQQLGSQITLLTVINPERVQVPPVEEGRHHSAEDYRLGMTPTDPKLGGATKTATRIGPYVSQLLEQGERMAADRLGSLAEGLKDDKTPDLKVTTKILLGNSAEEIVRFANNEGFGLIAMATHGRTTLGRGILGSVSDTVLRMSRVPVMALRPDEAEKYWSKSIKVENVIVPLDGTKLSESVLPYAEVIGRRLGATLLLTRVVDIGAFSMPMDGYRYISPIPLGDELGEESNEYLETLAQGLRSDGLKVEWKTTWGTAARAINNLAHETPNNLVLMATHGRSGMGRWLMGSVTDKVVRSSGDPVLIVPLPQAHEN